MMKDCEQLDQQLQQCRTWLDDKEAVLTALSQSMAML